MNRLNPLYILLLSIMVLFFGVYSVSKKQIELEDLQNEYKTKEDLALKLKALKSAYSVKRKRELLRVLQSSRMKKSGIKYEQKGNILRIKGKSIDVSIANTLVSKLLNGTYNITNFLLKKAKDGVDLEMEITWQ
ncbi:hypothetical protein MNB_SM-7-996 [hydrothermal vent metagenome]|uniref:Uncharacterized protein n=1 Tax=hydrothermal vent metagenome TaxID=652676 RepID=A0A1W1BKF6_9ZZZZ